MVGVRARTPSPSSGAAMYPPASRLQWFKGSVHEIKSSSSYRHNLSPPPFKILPFLLRKAPFPPHHKNHRVNQQLKDSRSNHPTNHRRGDSLHHIRAALGGGRPHDRQQTKQDGADGHDLWANTLHG